MCLRRNLAKYFFCGITPLFVIACGGGGGGGDASPPSQPPPSTALFNDVTATNVDSSVPAQPCMDVQAVDVDGDNDLDLVLAIEFGQNILLINDGLGRFSKAANGGGFLQNSEDHEDIALANFDEDNKIDIAFASEDTMNHEIYFNQGGRFSGYQLGATSVANTVLAIDFDHDGDQDLLFGGQGLLVLENNGQGQFSVYSGNRIPAISGVIQDLAASDVDNDSDLDIAIGIEGQNILLKNDGSGVFTDVTSTHLAIVQDETRVLAFADVDSDGDVDMFVGNVKQRFTSTTRNFIYLNDGSGRFLTAMSHSIGFGTYGGKFVDFDADGDPDLVLANANVLAAGDMTGFQMYLNSSGVFSNITVTAFGRAIQEHGFGVASGDFNADGKTDLYLCSRGALLNGSNVGQRDHLMLQR